MELHNILHNNKLLVFTLCIPIIAIVIFAVIFYVPQLFATGPQYNFLYYTENNEIDQLDWIGVDVSVNYGEVSVNPTQRYVDSVYKTESALSYVSISARNTVSYNDIEKRVKNRLNTLSSSYNFPVRFFIYDVDKKISTQISYAEVKNLKLYRDTYNNSYYNSNSFYRESPDGFKVRCGRQVLLFDSNTDCSRVFIGGNGKSIEIKNLQGIDGWQLVRHERFLGWIVPASGV